MAEISVCMITFNNERTVEKALKSVSSWASEIIVVDSFSTDSTPDIVRKYTGNFEQRAWPGFRDQYNYCLSKANSPWVMFIDADEEISEELEADIIKTVEEDNPRFNGYIAHRRTFYLGRWIMHGGWVPDRETRLYRKGKGRFEGGLHANLHVDGKVGELKGFYYHYNYRDISDQIDTINRYSGVAARDMLEDNKRFSWIELLVRPPYKFFREYFFKKGYKDGMPGFIIAVSDMYYVFIKLAKYWELKKDRNR